MRLKKTRKIAVCAVCAAIATVCVVTARFTPVGWVLLYAVAGAMTLFAVRMCGFGYGFLTYCATALISLAVLPYNLPYVLLIGLHALLREFLFGKPPRKVWRYVGAYVFLLGFFYAMPLAIFSAAKDTLGLADLIAGVGGIYVFCAIAAVALVFYDFILSYLVRGLTRAVARGKAKPSVAIGGDDPFAPAAPETHADDTTEQPADTARHGENGEDTAREQNAPPNGDARGDADGEDRDGK